MSTLTKIMREKLQNADLDHGEINDVSMSTMYGLEERGLVPADWRMGNKRGVIKSTQGGNFPRYGKVKLTKEGLRAARMIQGLRPDV
jgi:hypothetical protein